MKHVHLLAEQPVRILVPVSERLVPCEAKVLAVSPEGFEVDPPRRHGVKIPVKAEELCVRVERDALYELQCTVRAVSAERVCLAPPTQCQRIQRREYVRVPTLDTCKLEVFLESEGRYLPPAAAPLKNLSGGGCAVVFMMAIREGGAVRVALDLPGAGEMQFEGTVRHCFPQFSRGGTEYSTGIAFAPMPDGRRSSIIRHVFALQSRTHRSLLGAPPWRT
ncbi:MAG TPA: PilZ domain-containing protein [Stenomitos sp.]